jgi:predicted kinase
MCAHLVALLESLIHLEDPVRTPVLIMNLGLPGSGKSTWSFDQIAKAPPGRVVRVNNDDMGALMYGGRRGGTETRKHLEAMRDAIIIQSLLDGLTVIVDNTNIHPKHETRLRQIAALYGAVFRIQDFSNVPVETCIERDAQRPEKSRVGKDVILRMARDLARRKPGREPMYPQFYMPEPGLPTCWVFDVDGTLAKMIDRNQGGRWPYDWHRVGEDLPHEPVVEFAQMLILNDEKIIVFSGRDGVCFPETQDWLDKFVAPDLELHMRAAGDQRGDDIVKYEMFQEHIAGKYRVKAVIDDRDRVITMWRRVLGLSTWQVAEGRF